ncbi:MAG TPA: hypothetical protein VFU47_14825 [Armatimonadota bacterium]|nr:hypothetical protein [Armatimonadota bacterium]
MPVDYLLEFPCEPKRRLGRERLLELLRRLPRFRGEEATSGLAADEARDAGFQLRPLAFHCARCPANHAGREFGCFDAVELPLSAEAEEWLVELLPVSLKESDEVEAEEVRQRRSVRELIDRLRERPASAGVDERRGSSRLVERKRPAERRYGALFRRERLTSGQLVDLLLLEAPVHPETAELACRALGVWQDGGTGEDGVPEAVFCEPVQPDDDPSVADLKQYLHALMVASSLSAPVTTEVRG